MSRDREMPPVFQKLNKSACRLRHHRRYGHSDGAGIAVSDMAGGRPSYAIGVVGAIAANLGSPRRQTSDLARWDAA